MSDDPIIDVKAFAESGIRLTGTVSATRFTRLLDLLADNSGDVSYSITGQIGSDGNARLSINVSGGLSLVCNRCLGAVPHAVELRRELRFLPDSSLLPQVADEAPDVDEIVTPGDLRVIDWVEDEVLLGLPISPRHDDGRCCAPANPAAEQIAKIYRFAALAGSNSLNTKDQ